MMFVLHCRSVFAVAASFIKQIFLSEEGEEEEEENYCNLFSPVIFFLLLPSGGWGKGKGKRSRKKGLFSFLPGEPLLFLKA